MYPRDGARVRYDNPHASWHGREGVVVGRDSIHDHWVKIVFDQCYTVCYVDESQLVVLDDVEEDLPDEDLPDIDWR